MLAKLADIIIEIFAMESGLLRTLKIIDKSGEEKAKYQIDAVKVYVDETIPKIEGWAKQIVAYCGRRRHATNPVGPASKNWPVINPSTP